MRFLCKWRCVVMLMAPEATIIYKPERTIWRWDFQACRIGAPFGMALLYLLSRGEESGNWMMSASTGVDWRQKLETQRGAVLATELKNNANKLAKWTAAAHIAGADMIKLGYVTRSSPRDSTSHTILGTQVLLYFLLPQTSLCSLQVSTSLIQQHKSCPCVSVGSH